MNFGEHLFNTVIGSLDKINDMIKQHKAWNDESISLGLISDEDKLKTLKRELYWEVRLSNPNQAKISNLTQAIQTLEEIKHAQETRDLEHRKLNLTLPAQLNQSASAFLLLLFLAVVGSYAVAPICGGNQSRFCGYARSTVYSINQFFTE